MIFSYIFTIFQKVTEKHHSENFGSIWTTSHRIVLHHLKFALFLQKYMILGTLKHNKLTNKSKFATLIEHSENDGLVVRLAAA